MDCWLNRLLYAEAGEMRHRLCLVGDYLRTLRILGTLTTWRRLCITAVQTHMMRTARPKLRATTSIIAEAMALLLWQCDAPHQVRSGGENMYKPLLCCHFDLFWSCRQFGGLFLYCTGGDWHVKAVIHGEGWEFQGYPRYGVTGGGAAERVQPQGRLLSSEAVVTLSTFEPPFHCFALWTGPGVVLPPSPMSPAPPSVTESEGEGPRTLVVVWWSW